MAINIGFLASGMDGNVIIIEIGLKNLRKPGEISQVFFFL
jgi:hypothetical protein